MSFDDQPATGVPSPTTARPPASAGGREGQARIHSIATTAAVIEQLPVVAFDVTVQLPGRPGYRLEHRQAVTPLAMATLAPGATVPVWVASDDPSSIVLGVGLVGGPTGADQDDRQAGADTRMSVYRTS